MDLKKTYVYNDVVVDATSEFYSCVQENLWRYGLLVFETMHAFKGKVFFIEDHLDRLNLGMRLLQFPNDTYIDKHWIQERLNQFAVDFNRAVVRLAVRPSANGKEIDSLLIIKEHHFETTIIDRAICINNVHIEPSTLTTCKTGNRIMYYLAEKEMIQKQAHACLLLNKEGFVADANISNVFWVKDKKVFTPPLKDGCIAGILRKHILSSFYNKDIEVATASILPKELKTMDGVFLTNVIRGAQAIKTLDDTKFDISALQDVVCNVNDLLLD